MDSRTQQLSLVLALLAAAGLLVPTGAALFHPGHPSDDLGNQVELQPAGSGVAYLHDDKLVIDISPSNPNFEADGLNPDADFTFDDVFLLHYDGNQYADVWVTHEGEGVNFTSGGASIESRANNVTLGPNQSVTVGMTVDTSDPTAIENIEEFNVHARVAESPESNTASGSGGTDSSAVVTVTTPAPGQRIVTIKDASSGESVEADLNSLALDENDGGLTLDTMTVNHDRAGDSKFELGRIDPNGTHPAVANFTDATGMAALGAVNLTAMEDDPVAGVTLDLSASHAFLKANDAAGEDLAVYQYNGGTWHPMTVQQATTEDGSVLTVSTGETTTIVLGTPTAAFDVTATRVNQSEVTAGETIAVTATVTNRGKANGTRMIPLSLDGATVDQQSISLGANETANVSFTRQLDESGERILAIGGSTGVPVQVSPETNVTTADEGTTETPTATGTVDTTFGTTTTGTTEATTEPTTTTLVEEPASIGFEGIFGLGFAVVLALVMVFLVRRRPLG